MVAATWFVQLGWTSDTCPLPGQWLLCEAVQTQWGHAAELYTAPEEPNCPCC